MCEFPLAVENIFGAESDKMIFYGFVLRKEYKFLKNVYESESSKESNSLES